MIIKKYLVNTVEEVEALIDQDLGPNAVILTSKQIKYKGIKSLFFKDKFEVVAAVEDQDMQNYKEYGIAPAYKMKSDVETEPYIQSVDVDNPESKKFSSGQTFSELIEPRRGGIPGTYLDPRFNRKLASEEMQASAAFPKMSDLKRSQKFLPSENLKKAAVRIIDRFRPSSSNSMEKEELENITTKKYQEVLLFLLSRGLSHSNATQVVDRLCAHFREFPPEEKLLGLLRKEIAGLISVSGPIFLTKGKQTKAAFVGLSGTGKTSALISLAVQYLEEAGRKVAIISYAPNKRGEQEQLRALCSQFSLPYSLVFTNDEWQRALIHHEQADLLLIDTPGCSFQSDDQALSIWQELNRIEQLQTYLIISANAKDSDAINLIRHLSGLEIAGLIFTKLDETTSRGILINISKQMELPLAYLTVGPGIPGDFRIADPDVVARYILEGVS
jgi:flagellar biosynthesis protein FlhF